MASKKVRIRFEGKTLECRSDTTLAVALWENGVRHLSHSPKYGRPRGLTCARGHCTACLMRVDDIPNVRTCELPVREGMRIERQDAGAFYAAPMQKMLTVGSAFFPVGFYYKWFTRPSVVSRFFLDRIRPLTGVGRLPGPEPAGPSVSDSSPPQVANAEQVTDLGHFDTVIVGAGPAGLAAAEQAPGRVLILDDHEQPGGQRYGALRRLAGHPEGVIDRFEILRERLERTERLRDRTASREDVTFLARTRAVAGYHPDGLLLRRNDRLQSVRFGNLVWAAGALDTLGLFPGNDTPGVMGPRALYRLLVRDGLDLKGQHVLVSGGGLDFWLCAALLDTAGARLSLVLTESADPSEVAAAVNSRWTLTTGLELAGMAKKGKSRLRVSFTPHPTTDHRPESRLTMDVDLAVVCNRAKPAYDIPFQLGGNVFLQPDRGGFVLSSGEQPLTATGEADGSLPDDFRHPNNEVEPDE